MRLWKGGVAALKKDVAKINSIKREIEALEKQINELGRTGHDMEIKNGLRECVKRLKAEAKTVNARAHGVASILFYTMPCTKNVTQRLV